jgi:hypothetical protein
MHKYLTILGTSLIIFLALFVMFSHNVSAEGDANAYTCTVNEVNYNIDLNAASPAGFDTWDLFFDEFPSCKTSPSSTPTPSPTVTPTPTATPTPTQSSNPGGPGDGRSDGLGCGSHDCSSHPSAPQAQVLGAATGPQVLGLSTTSGEESFLPQLIQIFTALTSGGLGFIFLKKNG